MGGGCGVWTSVAMAKELGMATLGGTVDVCAAQTHQIAVTIKESTAESGKTSRTIRIEGPLDLRELRPPGLGYWSS